ncbi:hypothetical protein [Roseibium algae]|uniref:Tetratricopeptide repeat protein n=1 Tax=Roseibium algae TaxID=3123038 RepID=A0ABU8TT75_9HYPH
MPKGKFGLERLFETTRHSCLFLNDTSNGWYLGLNAKIDALVSSAVAETTSEQVIYYGSSMGGYGALVTGLARKDGDIHAFGPELRPGRPGFQSTAYGLSADDTELFQFSCISSPSPHAVHLYFGCFDAVDAANAVFAAEDLSWANIHLLRSSHASHDHLYSLNIIRRIIRTFNRDPSAELRSKSLIAGAARDNLRRFGALGEALSSGIDVDPTEIADLPDYPSNPGNPGNPGMMRLAAEAHAARGDTTSALREMQAAQDMIQNDPVLMTLPKRWRKEFPLRRVHWLLGGGREDEARELLAETCRQFPVDDTIRFLAMKLGLKLDG